MKIVLSPNPFRDKGLKAAQSAARILNNAGVDTRICLPFSTEGTDIKFPRQVACCDMQKELPDADILICFGGDGTILHAAKDANAFGIPILGVNMGSVGFMAELERGELSLLTLLAAGEYRTEERMMLSVRVLRGEKVLSEDLALNDAVISKGSMARVAEMEVRADGVLVTNLMGDGVIVSTPTGSTAYSLSAGGPLVWPMSRVVCVTPICPHSLTNRSVVLPDTMTIRLRPRERRGRFDSMVYSLDGRSAYPIEVGESLVIRKAPETLSLVHLRKQNFGALLRAKLRWQGAEIPTDDE